MKNIVKREFNSEKIFVLENGTGKKISRKDFFKNKPTSKVIRILDNDYSLIDQNKEFYVHFNLQISNHKKGQLYLLPKIKVQGYFDGKNEVLPLLDFDDIYFCECVEVKENISYDQILNSDFEYSMKGIKNKQQLKKEILKRYSKSLPHLPDDEILKLGVSITKLKFISKYNNKSYGSTRNGFGKGILEAVRNDKNVVALTADLKTSLKLDQFEKDFPNNFFEFGIGEQNMMSAAAGMCLNNKIPFVTSFASFNPGRNWDQLRVSVCYSNHNVKVVGSHAGLTTGEDGATHQCLEDIAIARVIPNLTVIVPSDEIQAEKATIEITKFKGPVYLRLSREKSLNITSKSEKFEIGKAQILREGEDVTLIGCGLMVQFMLEAAIKLEKIGIKVSVINLHTIKPIDSKTIIKYAKKTNCILTCEEHQIMGGLGSAVSEVLSKEYPTLMDYVGMKDCFGESGKGYDLLDKYGFSTKTIVKKVKILLKKKNER